MYMYSINLTMRYQHTKQKKKKKKKKKSDKIQPLYTFAYDHCQQPTWQIMIHLLPSPVTLVC